jgi:hypothetical protein
LNAPPISEATFTVDEAWSGSVDPDPFDPDPFDPEIVELEMVGPETGETATGPAAEELTCASDNETNKPAKPSGANSQVKNDVTNILCPGLRQLPNPEPES